jgi:hypothetical protein
MAITSIALDQLLAGMPGITPRLGAALAEAATLCMEDHAHESGVGMKIDGDNTETASVTWSALLDSAQARRAWADEQVTTEHGACGVAVLLVKEVYGLVVLERSRKRNGFDYWLGKPTASLSELFQGKTRMEVSGIRAGTESSIAARTRAKAKQTAVSDALGLPAIIAVVEFSQPRTRLGKR